MINLNVWGGFLSVNDIPKMATRRESLSEQFAVACIYCGVFLKDLISGWVSPTVALAFLVVGVVFSILPIFFRQMVRGSLPEAGGGIFLTALVIWALVCGFTQSVNSSSYFIAPLLAVLIVNTAPKAFLTLLVLNLLCSMSVQFGEYVTKSYFFVYETADGLALDETLFSGSYDVFRAKGFFQGPLSAVAFASWMAYFFRGSLFFAGAMLVSAFLSSGRLGMTISALLILVRLLSGDGHERSKNLVFGLVGLLVLVSFLISFAGENTFSFLGAAFDSDSSANEARFYFWFNSLEHFFKFNILNILFGDFGYVKAVLGATENDFLRILLDNGAFCFFLYCYGLALMLMAAVRQKSWEGVFVFCLIVTMMNMFPFIQSLNSALLFWFFAIFQKRILDGSRRPRGIQ